MRSIWIWNQFLVTREVWLGFFLWHFLNLHLHLLFMSHGRCDLSLYICTSYIYIYTSLYVLLKNYSNNYKKDIQWCLVGPDLLFVGLELKLELVFRLGLGLLLSWAWASSITLSLTSIAWMCPITASSSLVHENSIFFPSSKFLWLVYVIFQPENPIAIPNSTIIRTIMEIMIV